MVNKYGRLLFSTILIAILSFPLLDPTFSTGLDPGYFWALNYFFDKHSVEIWRSLIFPIGPLGFLHAPYAIGNNLLIGASILFLTKAVFIFHLLFLGFKINNHKLYLLDFIVALVISYFAGLDFSIAGTVGALLLLFRQNNNKACFIAACLMAAFGWYVKSSIGVLSFSIVVSFVLIDYWHNRSVSKLLFYFLSGFISLLVVGLIIFQNAVSVFAYSFNTLKLVFGYSGALALFPQNNWLLLGSVIALFILFPFIIKDRNALFAFAILAFSVFAAWKHSISRQDMYHYKALLYYFVVVFGIITVYAHRKNIYNFIVPVGIILLFYFNAYNLDYFTGYSVELSGYKNYYRTFIEYKSFNKKSAIQSFNNIEINAVGDSVKKIINNQTIDIYPWDLTYVPANNLNWKPRTTLVSGSYSSWLDKKSSENFSIENGPEFILFHLVNDRWGGDVGSIDNRYLLNDEPQTIIEIFNNYNVVYKNNKYVLLKKARQENLGEPQIILSETTQWKKWIKVPDVKDGIMRAHLKIKSSILQRLKSFFYKDEQLFIEYLFSDSSVFRYRVIPANAKDGLWINPFIHSFHSVKTEPPVTEIRFLCSNYSLYEKEISIDWELIKVKEQNSASSIDLSNKAFLLFGKKTGSHDKEKYLFQSFYNFDKPNKQWSKPANLVTTQKFSGTYSEQVNKESFSSALKIKLDSIIHDSSATIVVKASTRVLAHKNDDAVLVISTERNGKTLTWDSANIRELTMDNDEWNFLYLEKKLDVAAFKEATLIIYTLNSGKEDQPIFVDDLNISIGESR